MVCGGQPRLSNSPRNGQGQSRGHQIRAQNGVAGEGLGLPLSPHAEAALLWIAWLRRTEGDQAAKRLLAWVVGTSFDRHRVARTHRRADAPKPDRSKHRRDAPVLGISRRQSQRLAAGESPIPAPIEKLLGHMLEDRKREPT
jgi:hypothetical protein